MTATSSEPDPAVSTAMTPRRVASLSALKEFVATSNASAAVLLAATVIALAWANSPWGDSYERVWHTSLGFTAGGHAFALDARHWINDGLMAFFFFVVGLEIRRELDMGELRERRRIATPVLAAVGGMLIPCLIYVVINAGEPSAGGWGVVMGTDTAFAIAVLTLVRGASPRVRAFLLTLVIVDDVVALAVIAVVYTDQLSVGWLAVAVATLGVVALMRAARIRNGLGYLLLGLIAWIATHESGVHATIAGVMMGVLATAYPPSRDDLARANVVWRLFREEPTPEFARTASHTMATAVSPNERLQHAFHPWTSFIVVPLFALANAGVEINVGAIRDAAGSPVVHGIVGGLIAGKIIGITGGSWLVSRRALGSFPLTIPLSRVFGVSAVAGIGFTMALLIASLAFEGRELEEAKLGIIATSIIATVLAWLSFRVIDRLAAGAAADRRDTVAPPIQDLSDPVDPEVDHIRGSLDAPVVLVEYGDFECPYCGRAEPVLRELASTFGNDLAFVYRHLPLTEVHEHAQLAAEASEAAAAQGKFWEMHDALMAHQEELTEPDVWRYAEAIGLGIARFSDDLNERRHALRVERDAASADESGAAGTPTFFVNGHRHQGAPNVQALSDAVRRELDTKAAR